MHAFVYFFICLFVYLFICLFICVLFSAGALYMTLGFLSIVSKAIAVLVTEKETRTKEGMKMMGLYGSVWWGMFIAHW